MKRGLWIGILIFVLCAILIGEGVYLFANHEHKWSEPTCTTPAKCKICGKEMGEPLGHDYAPATCFSPKKCTRCGDEQGEKLTHSYGPARITKAATYDQPGEKVSTCKLCGNKKVETFELSPGEKEKAFKNLCKAFTFDEIARNPSLHKNKKAKYTGQVIQVMKDGNEYQLRVNITPPKYGTYYDDTIFVFYDKPYGYDNILEHDTVAIYGINNGEITYESVLGAKITLPCVKAKYVDIIR